MVSGIEAVFLANKDALLRFLRARGGGEEAEDLLQEVWIKLSAMPGAPVADPLAYLYRMANNLMLDRHRAEHRRLRRERDWSDAASASTILAQEAADGERLLLARDRVRRIEATLSAMGERTETIFRRFRLDGVSQQEIARESGISLSAVEKHLQKAYRTLLAARDQDDAE
jgi:RNA polymerase sigma-70 factor (ECF subfamily)